MMLLSIVSCWRNLRHVLPIAEENAKRRYAKHTIHHSCLGPQDDPFDVRKAPPGASSTRLEVFQRRSRHKTTGMRF